MGWIIAAIYIPFLWLVFDKLKLIRFSFPVAVAAASIGPGAILVILFGAQYFHPHTVNARVFHQVIPLAPQVTAQGRVIEITGRPDTRHRRGDMLFRIDPEPYQFTVETLAAQLRSAEKGLEVAVAGVAIAEATVDRAKSDLGLATIERDRQVILRESGTVSQAVLDRAIDEFIRSTSAATQADAGLVQSQLAVDQAEENIAEIKARLADAEYDLEHTDVRAPADGFITNLQIQVGSLVGGTNPKPVMDFVPEPDKADRGMIVAAFGQKNYLKIKEGQYAEIILESYPGQIFNGRVLSTIDMSSSGHLTTRGTVPMELIETPPSAYGVKVKIDGGEDLRLPAGTAGQVAVYTEEMPIAGIPVMIIVRTQSWLYYLF